MMWVLLVPTTAHAMYIQFPVVQIHEIGEMLYDSGVTRTFPKKSLFYYYKWKIATGWQL